MKKEWIPNIGWFEVHYTDKDTLYDYSIDVQAETAEEAKRIFESEHGASKKCFT